MGQEKRGVYFILISQEAAVSDWRKIDTAFIFAQISHKTEQMQMPQGQIPAKTKQAYAKKTAYAQVRAILKSGICQKIGELKKRKTAYIL